MYCFENASHEKIKNKKQHIAGTTVQVIRLNAIFALGTERSKYFSCQMFEHFAPSTFT